MIVAGITLIAAAVFIEISHYPWAVIFHYDENVASIPVATPKEPGNLNILPGSEPENPAGHDISTSVSTSPSVYVQLGTIEIPKLDISQPVLEGTKDQMHYGVGHVTDTAAIGQKGNCALAAHRSTYFRYLDKLTEGDCVILKVERNEYTYTVYDSFDVLPDETWVLSDLEGRDYTLTLITCTPYLVSSHRLIDQKK